MNFRRYYIPNSIVFITQVVQDRYPAFKDEKNLELLRATLHQVKTVHPFLMLGYVFLPDHFHLLIRPTGNSNFSQIMHSLKPNFTKAYKKSVDVIGKMEFWQKRFHDHIIRDEVDLHHHMTNIYYHRIENPKSENLPH